MISAGSCVQLRAEAPVCITARHEEPLTWAQSPRRLATPLALMEVRSAPVPTATEAQLQAVHVHITCRSELTFSMS